MPHPRPPRWTIAAPHPAAVELAGRLKVSPIVAQCLLNRGIDQPELASKFLRPTLKDLHDPALIPGLPRAAERIARAVRDREKIVVYGDYDVDGITATAILWHAITILGGTVDAYIPRRVEEGYGLNAEALAQIIDAGAKLIITVDCGVTAIEPAKLARARDVDLIITDHHEWKTEDRVSGSGSRDSGEDQKASPASSSPETRIPEPETRSPLLPDAHSIVHPRLPAQTPYPNPDLCGAGVAFKLAWGVGTAVTGAVRVSETFRAFLVEATALAALGTIADVVPLVGENRVLAHYGLGGLKQSKLTGIRALIESAGLTGQNLDSYDVGFRLAPRLNASGRLGHAAMAVEMLTTADATRAREIAVYLEAQNRERQAVERGVLEAALAQLEADRFDPDAHRAVVLGGAGWHPGVIGIVASRVVERLCRPAILIALSDGQGSGSGRSIAGFHLARALDACGAHLISHGGHEMAAGLKIDGAKLADFRTAFVAYAATAVEDHMLAPQLAVEVDAPLTAVTEPLVEEMRRLGPFGHGNRKPLLAICGATVAQPPRRVGKTADHLSLTVRQGNAVMRAIAFGFGEMAADLPVGTAVDLAVEPTINEFNGRRTVELSVKDLRLAAGA